MEVKVKAPAKINLALDIKSAFLKYKIFYFTSTHLSKVVF